MKHQNLLILAAIGLFSIEKEKAAAQQPQAMVTFRMAAAAEKPADATAEQMLRNALDKLHATNRFDVLPASTTTGTATHLLEVSAAHWQAKRELSLPVMGGFDDSLKVIRFNFWYTESGSVAYMATNVETGRVDGAASIYPGSEQTETFKLGYADLGWKKGMKRDDEKLRAGLVEKAASLLAKKIEEVRKKALAGVVASTAQLAGAAGRMMFPYRLEVLEATETDDDKAEKVRIAGGLNYDLEKGATLVAYTLREIKSGDKTFEHFEVVGKLKMEKSMASSGTCDVSKRKKDLLAALKSGKKVYCSVGAPCTFSKVAESQPQVGIATLIAPHWATAAQYDELYRKLRWDLLNVKNAQLLERKKFASLESEKNLQKREDFLDQKGIDQFKTVGADLLMEVKMAEPTVSVQNSPTGGAASASVSLSWTLRLLRVETGELLEETVGRQLVSYDTDLGEVHPKIAEYNRNPAVGPDFFKNAALGAVSFGARKFMYSALPPRIIVAEVTDTKKDRADEVLVVGDFNMANRDKYTVLRKRMVEVDGQMLPRFETIGTVSLRDSEGEGIAEAKVKEGGKEILAAMQAGDLLFCTDKPNWADKLSKWGNNQMEKYGY